MRSPARLAVLILGSAVLTATPLSAAHPIVPGFERFYSGPDTEPAKGGTLLLGELNCVSCHAAAEGTKKQAPVLDGIGTRARVSHLRKFLADPQSVKPGTTMPGLLAGDPDREAKVEALVHFLASTASVKHERPDAKLIAPGRELYNQTGCAACHGPRDAAGQAPPKLPAHVVPLGDLKTKYTVAGLAAFLENPLQSRPSGRMPHLLVAKEAKAVANYLLQGLKVDLPMGKGSTAFAYYEGEWDR